MERSRFDEPAYSLRPGKQVDMPIPPRSRKHPTVIEINGNPLKTTDEPAASAKGTRYIVVRAIEDNKNHNAELEALGAKPGWSVSKKMRICITQSDDLTALRRLSFVDFVDIYRPSVKIGPALRELLHDAGVDPPSREREDKCIGSPAHDLNTDQKKYPAVSSNKSSEKVYVSVFMQDEPIPSTDEVIARLVSEQKIDPEDVESHGFVFETHIAYKDIPAITMIDSVFCLDQARLLINFPVAAAGVNSLVLPYEYDGSGQIIHIADSGFDKGSMSDVHDAFAPVGGEGRIVALLGPKGASPAKVNDTDGHGTHVAGCALANGYTKSMCETNLPGSEGPVRGTAPAAKLVMTQILRRNGKLRKCKPADLFDEPYSLHGTRISNCSWEVSLRKSNLKSDHQAYDSWSRDYDDYVEQKNDLLVVFAAGNDGKNSKLQSQIGGLQACKNVLTVGSTMNNRSVDSRSHFNARSGLDADIHAVAAGSSRGPTKEGRIKPDICAPGHPILSALSRDIDDPQLPEKAGVSTDPGLWFLKGTSMAAALVSVLLIHGAVDMYRGMNMIDNKEKVNLQGFGRMNMSGTLAILRAEQEPDPRKKHGGFVDAPDPNKSIGGLTSGQVHSTVVKIPAGRVPKQLKVTLTWLDVGDTDLCNRLGLAVLIGKNRRHGNQGSAEYITRPDDYDQINNTQQIVWPEVQDGEAIIQVACTELDPRIQHTGYAMAWTLE
ncbi:hypothetical protein KVT40_007161 [Elsinoe batatas]|uniref:Peptidase S8/S53 domain-containing protein n=1 Tax=Elsinoe batatas TaxID=2601811 RepID=A0A8K0PB63_9PEZI|nr:hypothetical protein KVT40_007161 [Elsinoe batatas]